MDGPEDESAAEALLEQKITDISEIPGIVELWADLCQQDMLPEQFPLPMLLRSKNGYLQTIVFLMVMVCGTPERVKLDYTRVVLLGFSCQTLPPNPEHASSHSRANPSQSRQSTHTQCRQAEGQTVFLLVQHGIFLSSAFQIFAAGRKGGIARLYLLADVQVPHVTHKIHASAAA